MTDILYAALGGAPPRLAAWPLGDDGVAGPAHSTPLPGAPAVVAVSPDRRFLYADVDVDGTHRLLTYRIGAGGAPEAVGKAAHVGPYPCHIHVDASGRFLLAAYYADGMVTVHAIGADGVVGERVQLVETAPKAHFILTDGANRFAFTPHVGAENAIWQFRFDASTGLLTPNDTPKAHPDAGHGPRHMCFHPDGHLAFSDGEQGSSVTRWRYDPETGTLEPQQTLSTLPADWQGNNTCSQIHLTPDGRHLYVCNRGHDSLAAFAVDAAAGRLTAQGRTPAEPTPRPTAIHPDGRWLFNAGNTPRLVTYRIDQERGTLTRTAALETGPVAWLLATRVA